VLYAVFVPPRDRSDVSDSFVGEAIRAFVDLFFAERRIGLKKEAMEDAERIRRAWLAKVLPTADDERVAGLLRSRRFVVIEGPPGTGKTEMARRLKRIEYGDRGRIVQFHPGTTYESFVGGLAPQDGGAMGFTFRACAGHLIEAVLEARANPDKRFLLVIDEINRADLAKVLLNNLASVCLATSRVPEAEKLYLEALTINEQVLGASHPEVGITLNNLAVFYKTGKQYEKADAYYQRALSVLERGLGPKHPKIAVTLENYANLLRKLGRTEDARAIADRAKSVRKGDTEP
jgi:tetratricopeptide (TPR) repeat protein